MILAFFTDSNYFDLSLILLWKISNYLDSYKFYKLCRFVDKTKQLRGLIAIQLV